MNNNIKGTKRELYDHEESSFIKLGAFILFMGVLIALQALSSATLDPSIDIISPSDNQFVNTNNVIFDYYMNFNSSECNLIIDGAIVQNSTNHTPGFAYFTHNISGKHIWSIQCATENTTIESEQRNITLDQSIPTIVLFNPQNNTSSKTNSINFSFVALDNFDLEINCTLEILNYSQSDLALQNSIPASILIENISNGEYDWQLSCIDDAENIKISESRKIIINQTQSIPNPTYILTLNRRDISTGENAYANAMAPPNTSIRIEVCPNRTGFVECSSVLNHQNYSAYPLEALLPFTNKEGSYIVEAYFTGPSGMQTKSEHYNVISTISIATDAPSKPRINTPVFLDASATGGIGNLNFTWHLSNGTKIYRSKANITYTSPGNYTNTINVTDEHGNSRIKQVSLEVYAAYNTKIIVKDANTGAIISNAAIDIDNQKKDSDSNGEAILYIRSGEKRLVVSKQNYTIYNQDIQINGDNTINVLLTPNQIIKPKPIITLTYPQNTQSLVGSKTEVGFTVSHNVESNCSVYISEQPTGFFSYLGSNQVGANDKDERRFEIIDLEQTTYYWNVECIDKTSNSAISETRSFTVKLDTPQIIKNSGNDPRQSQVETVLKNIETMSPELKETIEALGLKKQVEDASKALKNEIRDLEALGYRNLDETALEAERQKIITRTESAVESAPSDFEIISNENFVDYIDESELQPIAEEILKLKLGEDTKLNMKSIMKNLIEMQQEAVTSTKVRTIKISYPNGEQKTITAVIREVKTFNISDNTYFIEYIPKEVAESASDIISPLDFEIIKDDPIIAFKLKGDTKIAYYFANEVSLDKIRLIRTLILSESVATQTSKITGFSISSLTTGVKANPIMISLIVALLAVAVFGTVKYEGHKAAQYALYLTQKKEKTHYVNVIVSDIHDNIEAGNLAKAVELYTEAKKAYSELPTIAKNDVYDQIVQVAKKIEDYQTTISSGNISSLTNMINQAENHIINGQMTEAINQYKIIEKAFHELDDNAKESIHTQISSLGNKLQILIASNT